MHSCYACGALLCPFFIAAAGRVSGSFAVLVLAVLAALCTAGAWVYTGGNFYALPQRLRSLWADGLPHSGAVLL